MKVELSAEFDSSVIGGLPGLIIAGEKGTQAEKLYHALSANRNGWSCDVQTDVIILRRRNGVDVVVRNDSDSKRVVAQRIRHRGAMIELYEKGNKHGIMLIPQR